MMRPKEVTDYFRRIDDKTARDAVRQKEAQLGQSGPGQFERANKEAPLAKVKHGYEAVPEGIKRPMQIEG